MGKSQIESEIEYKTVYTTEGFKDVTDVALCRNVATSSCGDFPVRKLSVFTARRDQRMIV